MAKDKKRATASQTLDVKAEPGEEPLKTVARLGLRPGVRHAQVAGRAAGQLFGEKNAPGIMDNTEALAEILTAAESGDKRETSRILAAQAVTLDALFTELATRAGQNMGHYLEASEKYMRLALKAQSNCRATLEALAKLHQPREQTVKHVHVNDGGQAVVADQIHQHQGERENGKTDKQSHATGADGKSPAMLGEDAQGNGVPISSGKGQAEVQNARRD